MNEELRVGTVVVYLAGPDQESNGTREHPAIVTRVWGSGPRPTVNLKVFPDCGEPFDATSMQHWTSFGWPLDGRFAYCWREV